MNPQVYSHSRITRENQPVQMESRLVNRSTWRQLQVRNVATSSRPRGKRRREELRKKDEIDKKGMDEKGEVEEGSEKVIPGCQDFIIN